VRSGNCDTLKRGNQITAFNEVRETLEILQHIDALRALSTEFPERSNDPAFRYQ
jgi:hypothetical protein